MVLVGEMSDDRPRTDAAESLLQSAIERRLFPAACAELGSSRGVLWHRALGHLTFDADAPRAAVDTVFDLASLTKPLATLHVVLALADAGVLRLDEAIARFFPEWRGADREQVTVLDLLQHTGGLPARLLERPPQGRRAFEHDICTMPLDYTPRSRSVYTDLGFILLGFIAEVCGGRTLADQAQRLFDAAFAEDHNAGHADVRLFTRAPADARHRTAPTTPLAEDERRGRRLVAEVHDNYASLLGGFAGHAGLFGTAAGVGSLGRIVLRAYGGEAELPPPFSPALIRRAASKGDVHGSSRAMGWDTMLPTSSCGTRLSPSSFGHVGFTGTSLWIDPERDRYYVLLTNRVCEGGTSDEMQQVRRAFHDTLATGPSRG